MMRRRSKKEILAYEAEMHDRVWWVRAHATDVENLPEDIKKGRQEALDRIEKELGLIYNETKVSDWSYGYWSGILAALRWTLGNEKDFLDT